MNLLRGVLSVGIVIGCLLSWIEIETEMGIMVMSGLKWLPVTILLYASILISGYAFYSSYNSTNQNIWIYLTCGLYGIGICIYIYLSVIENVNFLYMVLDTKVSDSVTFSFGLGIYLTGLLSFLLLLTGFDKADSKKQVTQQTFDQQSNSIGRQSNFQSDRFDKTDIPDLQDWLKENPGKSINDYFSKYK